MLSRRHKRAFALAILVYLLLAPISFQAWELQTWNVAAREVIEGRNFYFTGYQLSKLHPPHYMYWAYLPLYAFIIAPLWLLAGSPDYWLALFGEIRDPAYPLHALFLLKLPSLVSAILTAFALFLLWKEIAGQVDYSIALAWLLNPYVILIGAVWGHVDAFATMLTTFALLCLLKGRFLVSALLLGLAISAKTYPILVLPLFSLFVLRRSTFSRAVAYSFLSLLVPCLISLPYALSHFPSFKLMVFEFHATRAAGGMTYWCWGGYLAQVGMPGYDFLFTEASRPLFAFALLSVYLLAVRAGVRITEPRFLLSFLFLAFLAYYSTSHLVNEPFFLWALPLAILLYKLGRLPEWAHRAYYALPLAYTGVSYAFFTAFFWPLFRFPPIAKTHLFFATMPPPTYFLFRAILGTVIGLFAIFLYVKFAFSLSKLPSAFASTKPLA